MSKSSLKGSCLCGAVKIEATPEHDVFDACHCGMCRKWGGGPLMTINAEDNIVIAGEENITRYNSSDWAERCFCRNCGTHLFYRLKDANMHAVPVGIFENTDHLKFHMQIFVDHQPHNYKFENDTKTMTEAEVFAKYS